MAIFKGAGVAIATPFKENYDVDYDRFGALIDFQIENSTDAIIVCGTTGESATMTEEEHLDVIRYCIDKVAGRVPVIAGTGSNDTRTAIHLTKGAEAAGADGVLLVTPYYNKATQNGLYQHYGKIAKVTSLPIILYNVPSRTGCKIESKTVARMVKDIDNIVALKDATGDIGYTAQVMYDTQGDIDLYSGNDNMIVPIMSLGGLGVISVLSNIAPKETHDICALFAAGEIEKSRQMQIDYLELINALFCEVNPIPVKKALALMGMCDATVRSPLCEMEPEHAERLKKAMLERGLL